MVKRLFDWRIYWAVATFVAAMIAFESGVTTLQRVGGEDVGLLGHAYYSITLFFAAGTELGMPTGGPDWARGLLWVVYFMAPGLLISAIIEAVFGVLRPNRWRLRTIRDHTVVIGTDHLARAAMEALEGRALEGPVVSVVPPGEGDRPAPGPEEMEVISVEEEFLDDQLPERLRLERARRVLILTGNDCANLEVAARIGEHTGNGAPSVITHVSELGMLRELKRSRLLGSAQIFNGHRLAARQLVRTKLRYHFELTGREDQVVVAGFGRFGQTVLEQLQERTSAMITNVVVVDREASSRAVLFEEQVGFEQGFGCTEIDGDLADPRTWRAIEEAIDPDAAPPVFVLGTPDEDLNLRAAMLQWKRHPEALFVVRSYYHPALARRMEERGDFEIHNVADLLVVGIDKLIEDSDA